jgi:hypothetical protein
MAVYEEGVFEFSVIERILTMLQRERYVVQATQMIDMFNEQIVEPLVKDLCREAESTLKGVIATTSSVGRTSVEDILKREEKCFKELHQDHESSSLNLTVAIETVSNMLALEGALESFRGHLKRNVPTS